MVSAVLILVYAKTFSTKGGARKKHDSITECTSGTWGFLAYRSAGVRLGLQHLLDVSAEENMRFQLFSKIQALSAAFCAAHGPFPSLCTTRPHLGRQMSWYVPSGPAADEPATVPNLRGYIIVAKNPS